MSTITLVWMLPSPAWPQTGEPEAVLLLQANGEAEQILQPPARDDDVLVELGKAGIAQGVGKFAAQFPDGFALLIAVTGFDKERTQPAHNFFGGT